MNAGPLDPGAFRLAGRVWRQVEAHLEPVTAAATAATALIIWWQARLLRRQSQLSALIDLQQEWESRRMLFLRAKWAASEYNLEHAERVLEFLEDFAGFRRLKVLRNRHIWDSTLGWHAALYYFYNCENGNIARLREKWDDRTFFGNLESLWRGYIRQEFWRRWITRRNLEKKLVHAKGKFMKSEKALRWEVQHQEF
jgi:hypothetical protein